MKNYPITHINGIAISQGKIAGASVIHKFGKAPDFDPADGYVDIWDGADDAGINEMQYTYSTSAIIDSISSSDVTDTQVIEVQGLDADFVLTIQQITLQGQVRVPLTTNLIRVFRMKNIGTTNNAGKIYCYENTPLSAGVPVITNKVRAIMQIGLNQTLMALFTIPAGKTGYLSELFASLAGANKDSVNNVQLFMRELGGVFQLKYDASMIALGTSAICKDYIQPLKIVEKTDIELKVNTDELVTAISGGFDIILIDN